MRTLFLFSIAVAVAAPAAAHAQPRPAWDSKGWMLLGERTVNGRIDHDRIEVGRIEGKFSKLTLVVENNDLEMIDFKIEFADHTNYHPELHQIFREGTRTRVIELPPGEHVIKYLDFKYKNLPGEGQAKVGVWAWRIGDAMGPPPPPAAPAWDPAGWTVLGERTVNGRYDHDRIEVGRYEGKFTKLAIVVENSDLEMIDMDIKFGHGAPWHPELKHYFREGQRSRIIDFPGDERSIKYIDFKYRNVGEGRAKVRVYGRMADAPVDAPRPFQWESRGWVMLGEREVHGHGREDTDRIEVGRAEGRFRKLTIVVLDSDLEMIDFSVKLSHGGEPFHPEVNALFREGTRTKVIDLPGEERSIKWIEFKYRNLPGEGHAKVQVWAK